MAAVVTPVIPVGHGARRHGYNLRGTRVRLTQQELEEQLCRLLRDEPEPKPKTVKRYISAEPQNTELIAAVPAFVPVRDMLLARQEYEAAEKLRQIAQRIADQEDERDVEMLLLWQ